jgi:hypothetical protein
MKLGPIEPEKMDPIREQRIRLGLEKPPASSPDPFGDNIRQLQGIAARAELQDQSLEELMSPPGALGLPELLDQRRIEHKIPDAAFQIQPLSGYVFLHQIPVTKDEKLAGSQLVRPDVAVQNERYTASCAVLIAAGLDAMTYLYQNGTDIGNIVRFAKLALLRLTLGVFVAGEEAHVSILHCTEIRGDLDLSRKLRDGFVKLVLKNGRHVYDFGNGEYRYGSEPPENSEDYDGR